MIVVDASVVAEYLLAGAKRPDIKQLFASQDVLAAPSLIEYEIRAVLRRHNLRAELSDDRASECFALLDALRLELHDCGPLAEKAWALRNNFSFYDACYVSLAQQLRMPLYTLDKKLASAPGNSAEIILL